jgi:hypothetical protein
MLGFRSIPSSITGWLRSWLKTIPKTASVTAQQRFEGVLTLHKHLWLDDGHQTGLLTQSRIASQRLRVRLDTAPARNVIAYRKDRAPLGKTGAHFGILSETLGQAVQALGHLLSGVSCHSLCTRIDLDAWDDSRVDNGSNKGSAAFRLLADGLVVEDHTANAVAEVGGGDNELAIRPPRILGLGDAQLCESFVASWIALVHRQQTFVVCDKLSCR